MSMRAVLATWLVLAGWLQAAELELPAEATVQSSNVYVRSGPGEDYYPTEMLRAGDRVQVVREGRRGWLAIRPTRESYNWISGRYVREVENGMLEVIGDNVALRIGSDLSDDRDVYQMVLRRGDRVEMIDRLGSGSNAWYRVSPPDGEVRWMHRDHLDLGYPSGAADSPGTRRLPAPLLQPASYQRSRDDQSGAYPSGAEPRQLDASAAALSSRLERLEAQLASLDRGSDPYIMRASAQQPIAGGVMLGEPVITGPPIGEPVVTGPMMVPPPPGPGMTDPYWDPYCDCPPLVQSFNRWIWTAGVEATFLYPKLLGSSSTVAATNPFSGAGASITREGTLDNEWVAGPRVWIGVQRTQGFGIVGRYWQLGDSTDDLVIDVPIGAHPDFGPMSVDLLATERVSAWNADAELTFHWEWESGFGLNGSAGYRHAELEGGHLTGLTLISPDSFIGPAALSYVERDFHGDGVTYSLGGNIPLGRGSAWHIYVNLRGSNLWGTAATNVYTATVGDRDVIAAKSGGADMFIAEIHAGVQWESRLQVLPANAFVRVGFEYQNWSVGSGVNHAVASSGGLPGANLAAVADASGDLELQLIGVAAAAGITY